MGRTARYGLETFGGTTPGSLDDNGGKFTGRDRRTIDSVLAALEAHDHSGGDRLAGPESAPTLAHLDGQGTLAGGVTYYYRVAYVDAWGLETAAGPEASVAMPGQVAIPGNPMVNAIDDGGAGALGIGMHQYGLTAISSDGETPISGSQGINISDWRTVEISATAVPTGATEFGVWRQGPADSGFTKIATVAAATGVIFTDDGSVPSDPCACDPENMPPLSNSTSSDNAVRVTIPLADVQIPTSVHRWRIYRSTQSGLYRNASLVAEVTETIDEVNGDQLVDTFLDDGSTPLLFGQPLETGQTFDPPPPIQGSGVGSGMAAMVVSDGTKRYRLLATIDGDLETKYIGDLDAPEDPFGVRLMDANGIVWHVVTDVDGLLVTNASPAPEIEDPLYMRGEGPHIATPDATLTWQLEITTDGSLETVGAREAPTLEQLRIRESKIEPDTPESGGVIYLFDGALRFKDSAGAVSVLS